MLRRMSSAQFYKWQAFYCRKHGIKLDTGSESQELLSKFTALAEMHKAIDKGKAHDG